MSTIRLWFIAWVSTEIQEIMWIKSIILVKGIHQRFNPGLQIEGILFTMDNCRYNNAKRNKQAIKTTYGSDIKIFEQTIPRTESLAETASEGVSIFAYDGKSKGADSYLELVQEVLKHA